MEIFDQTTLPQSTRKTDDKLLISVAKSGQITLNHSALTALGLNTESKVGFVVKDQQLYLIPNHDKGFQLRISKISPGGPKSLIFSHVFLTEKIMEQIPEKLRHANASTFRMIVGKQKTTIKSPEGTSLDLYPIITTSATFTIRKK